MKKLSKIILCAFLLISGKVFAQENELIVLTTDSLLGKSTPEFSGASLDGVHWDNDKLNGKVVLLNFWFIGCPPCMTEIKHFNELHKDYHNNEFVLLSIAPNIKEDVILFNDTVKASVPAKLRDHFKGEPIEYIVIPACDSRRHDDPERIGLECDNITKDFYISGYPTTLIIDKTGIVRHVQIGFQNAQEGGQSIIEAYRDIIDQLLVE